MSIEADTWLEVYGKSGGSKKTFKGTWNKLVHFQYELEPILIPQILSAKKKFLPKDKGGLDWHNALKNQVVNFRKHRKKCETSNTFKITSAR